MSAEVQTVSDLRVKYVRRVSEDRREDEQHTYDRLQTAEPHTEEKLPAVGSSSCRALTVALGVLYVLILAGFIARYISVTLEKDQLQGNIVDVTVNNTQLQGEVKRLKKKLEGNCPDGWTRFRSSCYFKFNETKTWDESKKLCQSTGGHLVVIKSPEEQDFVVQLNMKEESWIGLREVWTPKGNVWQWVDGSPLNETFWGTDKKENSSSQYTALCCDQQGKWMTRIDKSFTNHYLCEKNTVYLM